MRNIRKVSSFSAQPFILVIVVCLIVLLSLAPVSAKEFRGGWSGNSDGNSPNNNTQSATLPSLDGLTHTVDYLNQGMPKLRNSNPLSQGLYARNISILVSYARIKEAIQYAEKNWKWDNSRKQNQTLFKELNSLLELDYLFKANVFAAQKAFDQGDPGNSLQYIGNAIQVVYRIIDLTMYSDALYETDLNTAVKVYTNLSQHLSDSRKKLEKFLIEN